MATLTFSKAGTQSVVLEGIPVGTEVTVTEDYNGSHYKVRTEPQTAVIASTTEPVVEVSFTNDYNGSGKGGHGILNEFKTVENPDYDPTDPESPEYLWDEWTKPNMNNG